jgi:uncharacterized protein (TIGR03067 family)
MEMGGRHGDSTLLPRVKEEVAMGRLFILGTQALAILLLANAVAEGHKDRKWPKRGGESDVVELLDDKWDVVELLDDQEPAPAKVLRTMAVVIRGNRLILKQGKDRMEARISHDPRTKPKKIDLRWEKEQVTCWGIYELKGDRLTICCTI